jgi:hypothetical protein
MMRGLIAGVLGLSLLQAVTSSPQATANTTGIISFVSHGLARWLNPTTPLIPNIAGYGQPLTPADVHKIAGGGLAPIAGGLVPGLTVPGSANQLPTTSNAGPGARTV